MVDCMGREIKVGDYVAYATRAGNSASMRIGKILEVEPERIKTKSIYYGSVIESWWSMPKRMVALQFNVSQEIVEKLSKES